MMLLPFFLSKKVMLLIFNFIIILGLGIYGYSSLRHDMRLIVEREVNIFDIFGRRVELADPSELLDYIDSNYTPFSSGNDANAYVYGYELTSHERFSIRPIIGTDKISLATYRYILSYPDVVGLYLLTNENLLIGISYDKNFIPEKIAGSESIFKSKPWVNYFGCDDFSTKKILCSKGSSFVSDIGDDLLTHEKIFVLYYPFNFFNYKKHKYQYGLIGVDINTKDAFKYSLNPFDYGNPTQSLVSFHVPECPAFYICFQQEMMRTKANSPLYLIWHYRIDDFLYRQLKSSAFMMVFIVYILIVLTWSKIHSEISRYFHKDKLTGLSRRDILDEKIFHKYNFLLLVDIDNFKYVNDTYGHDTGDFVLNSFAVKIKNQLRVGDIALRWGGEEFLILLQVKNSEDKIDSAVIRLLEPLIVDGVDSPITISGGLVKIDPSHTIEKATKLADNLLYEVKRNGKNNFAKKENGKVMFFVRNDRDNEK
ncbi:GGDEF domain-containing protein (plasmid) [Aeromonas dhakensis]|uniref:GGDEF domain-containing protein n=1 Tax=Aeromonas dhakensis TaxID=196024 RepID=UPI0021B244EA|nr:GGDEF domain-containing protein [Aeromonas dhakensis]UXB09969.1 GGDEF domain-containing protein [Aeromonas dhakensis]